MNSKLYHLHTFEVKRKRYGPSDGLFIKIFGLVLRQVKPDAKTISYKIDFPYKMQVMGKLEVEKKVLP